MGQGYPEPASAPEPSSATAAPHPSQPPGEHRDDFQGTCLEKNIFLSLGEGIIPLSSERFRHLPKVTQKGGGEARVWTWRCLRPRRAWRRGWVLSLGTGQGLGEPGPLERWPGLNPAPPLNSYVTLRMVS